MELSLDRTIRNNLAKSARFSVAPMMAWTDTHCRYFHRLISKKSLLYTEMITAPALVLGGAFHLLEFNAEEYPVALQLGGSDPKQLAEAASIGARYGYPEINLNLGCPSDRVQSGMFGAVLMTQPDLVCQCLEQMKVSCSAEITVKCRIGVDDQVSEDTLPRFLEMIESTGVGRVAIHARKAFLKGLSPKENRDIPPLDYFLVREMKRAFPNLHISVNGGVNSLFEAKQHLSHGLDGVMIGRAAYHNPYKILGPVDNDIFGYEYSTSATEIGASMIPYIEKHLKCGGRLNQVTRHMFGLFAGQPGARHWRRRLSEIGSLANASLDDYLCLLKEIKEIANAHIELEKT